MEFNFPENCTCCSSRFGPTNCLLPYHVVKGIELTENLIESIMKLTELHAAYRIEYLNYNYYFQRTIASPPASSFLPSETGTVDSQNQSQPSVKSQATEDRQESSEQEQLNLTTVPQKIEEEIKKPTPTDLKDEKIQAKVEEKTELEFTSVKRGKQRERTESTKQEAESSAKVETTSLSEEQKAHLVKDLTIAIAFAYSLTMSKRIYLSISHFISSFEKEIDLIARFGNKYEVTIDSDLSTTMLLAKELVAYHSDSHLDDWEMEDPMSNTIFCILGYERFKRQTKNPEFRLVEAVLEYCKSIFYSKRLDLYARKDLSTKVEEALRTRMPKGAFKWFSVEIKRPRPDPPAPKQGRVILRNEFQGKSIETKREQSNDEILFPSLSESVTLKVRQNKQGEPSVHTCPTLPKDVSILIDNQLGIEIVQSLKENSTIVPESRPNLQTQTVLRKLIIEIISHHSQWNKDTFNTTTDGIVKVSDYADITIQQNELIPYTHLINDIIRRLKQEQIKRRNRA